MKKLIDIPDSIFKELKIMAVEKDTNLKKMIEDMLIDLVKSKKNVRKRN